MDEVVVAQDGKHRLTLIPSLISWSWVIRFSHEPDEVFVKTVEGCVACGEDMFLRDDDDGADPWEAAQ